MKVTYDEFAAHFAELTLDEIRAATLAETGVQLKAKRKIEALEESYRLYCEQVDAAAGKAPPAPPVLDADAFAVVPAGPTSEQLEAREAELAQVRDARPAGELRYEARSRTGRAFHKFGRVFAVKWEPIGTLTDGERKAYERFAPFIQLRVKG